MNSGTWQELPNGDKLWRLNVVCPDALSINICYDKFWIPDGGKFFVYSKDKSHTTGAFTSMEEYCRKNCMFQNVFLSLQENTFNIIS